MKLHGKILAHYFSCSSPVDKEGYLHKKGELNTSYQRRWCILKGNLLFYQDRPGDRDPLGVIVLEGCSVQLCESDEQFAFSLVFNEPGLRTYKFAAEDQKDLECWIKALHSAHHVFLTLLLKDLKEQYLEASKAAGVDPINPPLMATNMTAYSTGAGSTFYTQGIGPSGTETGSLSNNQLLQVPPASGKPTNKRSPKLWPKRNAHVTPVNGPSAVLGEWSEPMEEFTQLHEYFGEEVKKLIADWMRRGTEEGAMTGKDLIDFD